METGTIERFSERIFTHKKYYIYQKPIIGKIEIFKSNCYIGKYWGNMKEFREKSCVWPQIIFYSMSKAQIKLSIA